MNTTSPVKIDFAIEDEHLSVSSIVGRVAVSEQFKFNVATNRPDATYREPKQWLGKPASILIHSGAGSSLAIDGLVVAAEVEPEMVDGQLYVVERFEVAPQTWPLNIGREHRYFQDLSTIDIVKQILADAGVQQDCIEFATTATYAPRVYTVQWGESDWSLVTRLLAEEGVSFRYDFDETGTKLVFFDESSGVPSVPGGPIPCLRESGMDNATEAVHGLTRQSVVTSDQVVVGDYDSAKPAVKVQSAVDSGSKLRTQYEYPGKVRTPTAAKVVAHHQLEGLRRERNVIRGRSNVLRLWPGRTVEIEGSSILGVANLFVTSLDIHIKLPSGLEHELLLRISFSGVPAETPYRPLLKMTTEPMVSGPQTAMIVGPSGKELHTDDTGRVRAQHYWDRLGKADDKSSVFMRVGQFALGGSMVRPRIGWDVLVEHAAGDVDAPAIITHLYDGEHPPPYSLPANKTRTAWQTATTPGGSSANEVRFEDKTGSEEMFLNASKDMVVSIGDTKAKKVGSNHTHDIGSNSDIKVGATRNIGVTSDQAVQIGASESVTVSGNASAGIGGGETVTIGGGRSVTTIMGKELNAKAGRSMTVAGNMMDISGFGVNRAVLGSASISVGAAWISAAASGLANMTGGAAAETVGGVKMQLGAKGVSLSVKGALAETVGAAYVGAAGADYGESATGNVSFLVGGAFLVSSPSIEIEADSEISITCGGSSLKITSGSIEVTSPAIPAPAGTLGKTGSKIQHNP